MKTSREIAEKCRPYGDGPIAREVRDYIQMLVEDYAREVAQNALNRAAENAKSYGMAQTDQNRIVYPGVIKESITKTEIILP